MLPANFVPGVEEHPKDGFTIVGIHLEVLVGESTSNSLEWHESDIELCVIAVPLSSQVRKQLPVARSRWDKIDLVEGHRDIWR
jgi:hypothetical protein